MSKINREQSFDSLVITCDGKHTRVMVDGEDISGGCLSVSFRHDAATKLISLSVDTSVQFTPKEKTASGN